MLPLLQEAKRAVALRMKPFYLASGLTQVQWVVLRTVNDVPGLTFTQVRGLTAMPKLTLSKTIRQVEDRSLIRRIYPKLAKAPKKKVHLYGPDGKQTHRRYHYQLEATVEGALLCREGAIAAATRYLDMEPKFPEDQLAELFGLLRRFITAMTGVSPEPSLEPYTPYAERSARVAHLAKTLPRNDKGHLLPASGIPRPPKPRSYLTKRDLDRLAGADYPRKIRIRKKKPKANQSISPASE